MSQGVGYDYNDSQNHARPYQCWVRLGHEIREVGVAVTMISLRETDTSLRKYLNTTSDAMRSYETTWAVKGDDVVATRALPSGDVSDFVDRTWTPLSSEAHPIWRGYLCWGVERVERVSA